MAAAPARNEGLRFIAPPCTPGGLRRTRPQEHRDLQLLRVRQVEEVRQPSIGLTARLDRLAHHQRWIPGGGDRHTEIQGDQLAVTGGGVDPGTDHDSARAVGRIPEAVVGKRHSPSREEAGFLRRDPDMWADRFDQEGCDLDFAEVPDGLRGHDREAVSLWRLTVDGCAAAEPEADESRLCSVRRASSFVGRPVLDGGVRVASDVLLNRGARTAAVKASTSVAPCAAAMRLSWSAVAGMSGLSR